MRFTFVVDAPLVAAGPHGRNLSTFTTVTPNTFLLEEGGGVPPALVSFEGAVTKEDSTYFLTWDHIIDFESFGASFDFS